MSDPDIERMYYLSLIEKGQAHNSIGQYQQAISTANIVLTKYPDQFMALEIKGDALDKEKNYKEAMQCYDKILLIPNLNPDMRLQISIKKNSTKFMQLNSK
jgi:tetratricopeptide (TPR) repeat protein